MKSRVMEEVKRTYRPEFLNRIDNILVFRPLSGEEMKQIVNLLLRNFEKRCKKQMDIDLTVRANVKEYLARSVSDSKYGARPLKREIQRQMEDAMAEELLAGKIGRGDQVTVGLKKDKIVFHVKTRPGEE